MVLFMKDLDGTTVVITGAASGLGRAFAEGFLADGARVVGTDIDEDGLAVIATRGVSTARCDVSVDADVRAMIDLAVAETGRVDVLINNAGYINATAVENLADGEFERLIAVHLFGCIYGMRAAIPVMRAQGRGRIINLVSRAAEARAPNTSAYAAAKAGIFAASRIAATEVADADILVNMLFPGMTNTGIWGRDMPGMQRPESVYPAARMLATLPTGGPTGEVFYRDERYPMFDPANDERLRQELEAIRRRAR